MAERLCDSLLAGISKYLDGSLSVSPEPGWRLAHGRPGRFASGRAILTGHILLLLPIPYHAMIGSEGHVPLWCIDERQQILARY